jgi:hypothetical protein
MPNGFVPTIDCVAACDRADIRSLSSGQGFSEGRPVRLDEADAAGGGIARGLNFAREKLLDESDRLSVEVHTMLTAFSLTLKTPKPK